MDKWVSCLASPLIQFIDSQLKSLPSYTRNKVAQLFCFLFIDLYPKVWMDCFASLYSLLEKHQNDPAYVTLFLCVVEYINEEITSPLIQRSSETHLKHGLIKDCLREREINRLVEMISKVYLNIADLETKRACLSVLGKLIHWIDLGLIAHPATLDHIFKNLAVNELQKESIECIGEMVYKGMSPRDKCALISSLNIIPNILNINPNVCISCIYPFLILSSSSLHNIH
jgi:hypothetical protein